MRALFLIAALSLGCAHVQSGGLNVEFPAGTDFTQPGLFMCGLYPPAQMRCIPVLGFDQKKPQEAPVGRGI